MKKFTLFILLSLIFFCTSITYGQTQLNHPARFFRTDDGKLYVNRNQPMYLYLSSSPQADGNLERLESESSSKYANPFYFDSDGYNSIRTPWRVDTVTKQVVYPLEDIVFDVYADGTPPSTNVKFKNSKEYKRDGKIFYGPRLSFELTAKDATSGVDQTFYSLNGEAFKPYNQPIELTVEDEYSLKFYSVDNVGNVEKISTSHFILDLSPPVGSWTLEGDVYQNTASANSKIIILGNDMLSGIKEIRYQINENPIRKYTNGISLNDLPSNSYTLNYWIEDNVGNIFNGSDGHVDVVQSFTIDRTPPKTSAIVIGDQHQETYLYVSPRSTIQLDANDTISGVRNIIYGINNSRILDHIYEDPIAPENSNGLQTIYFQAFDMVANRSTIEEITFYNDSKAPITRIEYSGSQFFTRDTLFINTNTEIQLISKDNASGVQLTEYRINDGEFHNGNKFKLNDGGLHFIGFRSTDNVNNKEIEKKSVLYVDNEPPDIYVNFSIQAIREEKINGEKIKVYPPYVRMFIGATDKHCGTQDIFYSVDGGESIKYSGLNSPADREIFNEEKSYEVLVIATDKLGNESNKKIRFIVSNQ